MTRTLEELIGKTIKKIGVSKGNEHMFFIMDNGDEYMMYHPHDCCEDVYLDDVVGNIQNLIGVPIVAAEEVTNNDNPKPDADNSFTWTFYKFVTRKGFVTLKWYGTSSGYYSEDVEIRKLSEHTRPFRMEYEIIAQ